MIIIGGAKDRNTAIDQRRRAVAKRRLDARVKQTAERLKELGIHNLRDMRRQRNRVRALDMAGRPDPRRDAASTLFHVASELEYIKSRVAEDTRPETRCRDFVPMDPDPPDAWAETSSYVRTGLNGLAQLMADYATDAPSVDVDSSKHSIGIETYAVSMGWSIQELGAAMFAGRSLKDWKAKAAMRACEERIDIVIATGDTQRNTTGVLNDPNVGTGSTTSAADWSSCSSDQMLADCNEIVEAVYTQTLGALAGERLTLALPTTEFMEASQKNMAGINENVLSYLIRTSPFLEGIDQWNKLTGAGSGSVNRMWCYRRSDEVLYMTVPMEPTLMDEQLRFLTYIVPVICRIAGAVVQKPLEMEYRDFPA